MKKLLALLLCAALAFCVPTSVLAEETEEPDAAGRLLADVEGTYEELFTRICDPQYDQLWLDDCAAVVGDDMAEMCADLLKNACTATIYGEEAMEAYAADPEATRFDCFFIGGVDTFSFSGSTISGSDAEGNEIFSYEYEPAGEFSIGGLMNGYLYETDAEDAGMFRYFLLMPDTPASTYHIEFRYGESKEDLALYDSGSLAYWLAAGIPVDCDEQMIEDVIELFCKENLADMGGEEYAELPADPFGGLWTAVLPETEKEVLYYFSGDGTFETSAVSADEEAEPEEDAGAYMVYNDRLVTWTDTVWFGGITGYAGGYEDESLGIPVTVFSGCTADGVAFNAGEGSEEPGAIVGAGFYSPEMAAMGAPFDAPSVYVIED